MEAVNISETLGKFYQTTRRNNPEDSHLQAIFRLTQTDVFPNTKTELGDI
jgi:hypothetical protein